jgi:hypothetical protein
MVAHILWYFDNTTATPNVQLNVGPLHPGAVAAIYKAHVHGNMSFQSFNAAVPWQEVMDVQWGFQYVPHGSAPTDILTSASDDHWLWRHAIATKNDLSRAFAPSTASGVIQSTFSLIDTFRGQGNRPGADIDVYLSFRDLFGLTSTAFQVIGTIDFYYE